LGKGGLVVVQAYQSIKSWFGITTESSLFLNHMVTFVQIFLIIDTLKSSLSWGVPDSNQKQAREVDRPGGRSETGGIPGSLVKTGGPGKARAEPLPELRGVCQQNRQALILREMTIK
jgi:uncharacterized membrane protein